MEHNNITVKNHNFNTELEWYKNYNWPQNIDVFYSY